MLSRGGGVSYDAVCDARRGYWESVLETSWEGPSIRHQGVPSWGQQMWQQGQSFIFFCRLQDLKYLNFLSPCPMHPHPHRSHLQLFLDFAFYLFICLFIFLFFRTFYRNGRTKMCQVCSCGNLADSDLEQAWIFTLVELSCWMEEKGPRSKAETQEEKWCNWRALIEELVMEVHSTRVQWPAPLQGPHLLICGSPLPGKYAASEVKERRILLAHCN